MAHDDITFTTGDVSGTALQAHTIQGNVYLQALPPATPPPCAAPTTWAETTDLPVEIADLLWAQQQSADLLPYQLPGARTPALGTIYVRQDLGGGVEDSPAAHVRPAPMLDDHGRLVEVPTAPSVRMAVRPPSKLLRAALDTDQHLLVLGGPGQGKSTLTLRLSADVAGQWTTRTDDNAPLAEPVVPLRITARALAQHLGSSFAQALADSAFAEHGRYLSGPLDSGLFVNRVARCRWLLLVDALDEVTDSALRATLVHTLSAWASRDVHRVLLTTRPTEGGALAALQRAGATRYELQPFDAEALCRFAHNWFEEIGEEHADRFLHQIREAHLNELVEVPLLATIAAIVFEQYRDRPLPGNQYELYVSYLDFIRSSRPTVETCDRHCVALVEHLGRTRLTSESPLTTAAREWARCNDVPEIDGLLAYLLKVGPFVKRGDDIAFLHHSFAEHVAATASARELPPEFDSRHDDIAELLHEAYQEESGGFARAVLLHYTHLHAAEADRMLRWLHGGGADEHLLAARLLARHLPAGASAVDDFLVTARAWAVTTRYPARLILRETSRATRHAGLVEWLAELMNTTTAPWASRAEAAVALAVRLRCAHTDAAIALLKAIVDDRSAVVDDRLVAAEALAHSGSSERDAAERGLRAVLEDDNAPGADHRSAAVVLSAFDEDARARAIAALERLVSDPDTPVADLVEAATGLLEVNAGFHELCAGIFLQVLRDRAENVEGRQDATVGLASLGQREQAVEALTPVFTAPLLRSGLRANVAPALALLGPQHRAAAVELLLSELDDPMTDPLDRVFLARHLGRLGHRERAVAVLREVLADPASTWNRSGLAASGLADLGPAFRQDAAEHFEHALSHIVPKGHEYTFALRTLAGIGEPYRGRALALMWAMLADPDADAETRCTVASDLVQFAPERHLDVVRHLMTIIKTERSPSVLVPAWREVLALRPDLCHEATSALLSLAEQAGDGMEAPIAVGRTFNRLGAADRAVAVDLLRTIARDKNRSPRTRLSAVRGFCWLGRSYHRRAAELLSELIATGAPISLPSATLTFAVSGSGVRAVVAEALCSVLRSERTNSHRLWTAVQALEYLGVRVPDDVLRGVAADESAFFWRRTESALALADRDEAVLPAALTLHRRGAEEIKIVVWHKLMVKAARVGAEVRPYLQAILADPNASRRARAAAASSLGEQGVPELLAQAEDPYLGFESRSEAYRLLAAIDPSRLVEAAEFHRAIMDHSDEQITARCDMAVALTKLDRSYTTVVVSFLRRCAESSLLNPWVRASAVLRLCGFDDPASPRLVQNIVGLCHDPELGDSMRARLVRWLPHPRRTEIERALLAERGEELADRLPAEDVWGERSLCREAEAVIREALTSPASGRKERREAAVELAGLSGRHVPEAVAVLLADGSPDALAEAAKLGEWQHVLDRVLDETRPLRARLATALRLPNMADAPAVRDMLARQENLSWRDRVDVLSYLGRNDELRALRDDCAGLLAQRWRAAGKLVGYRSEDRAAAARLYHQISADPAMRPPLRRRAATDLAVLGTSGRAEAALLLRAMAVDESLPVRTRSDAANQMRNYVWTSDADMLAIQRGLETSTALERVHVLRSISWAPSHEAIDELLRTAADRSQTPRVRLWCARSIVERRRDLKDRCAVVAREIAFDAEAPWHIRLRAAKFLARWSEVMRADALALVLELRGR